MRSKTLSADARIDWREVVGGADPSLAARSFRALASAFALPYSAAIRLRGLFYDVGLFPQFRAERPTIAVGNLTLGGVGKTPFVAKIAETLLAFGVRPGLISRGYKAKEQASLYDAPESNDPFARYRLLNDEAKELEIRLPDVPHFLGSDRVEVARALVQARPELDALVLDDAYQHRRIARDLNILVLDALDPFGGERVFPAGFLREPLSGAVRADVVALNRADLIETERKDEIKRRVMKLAPRALWIEIAQRPDSFYTLSRTQEGKKFPKIALDAKREDLKNARLVAFCGLGAPNGFKKTLEREGLNVVSFRTFPDHCAYGRGELETLAREVRERSADLCVTTLKDLVKLPDQDLEGAPIGALGIGVSFLSGERAFSERLLEVCRTSRLS